MGESGEVSPPSELVVSDWLDYGNKPAVLTREMLLEAFAKSEERAAKWRERQHLAYKAWEQRWPEDQRRGESAQREPMWLVYRP